VVLDRALVAAGDEDHLAHAGGVGLLDRVLDQRLVHHRQHLLGLRLGGGQEARAEAGHGECWRFSPCCRQLGAAGAAAQLIEQCDGVCVLLAFFTRYRGLIGERYLASCKPNQVLVSLAHSSLFDEAALAEALNGTRMAAAWFDSLEPGALDPGRPLNAVRHAADHAAGGEHHPRIPQAQRLGRGPAHRRTAQRAGRPRRLQADVARRRC
jgi:hypothetical protein